MKARISVTVDEETVFKVRELMRSGKFRNKSHVIEHCIKEVANNE